MKVDHQEEDSWCNKPYTMYNGTFWYFSTSDLVDEMENAGG